MNEFITYLNYNHFKALELKDKFKVLEKNDWNSITVMNELIVQIGHVFNVLNHNDFIDEIGRTWIKNMGDELSDILLQLSTLAKLENIEFDLDNYKDYCYDNLDGLIVLSGQLSEAILEKNNYRFNKPRKTFNNIDDFIKDRIIKLMLIVFNYSINNNIDINKEFILMYEDASNFIEKKTNNGNN
ncbi:MAG: hypothetical protein ACI4WW_01935 [Candidatus Coprovivens sp.]